MIISLRNFLLFFKGVLDVLQCYSCLSCFILLQPGILVKWNSWVFIWKYDILWYIL